MSEIDRLIDQVLAGKMTRRQMLQRAFALGLSGSILGMALEACAGASTSGGSSQPLVGFSFPDFEHFRWPHDRAYFEDRAKELGMRTIIQGAQQKPAVQEQQVEAMIAQGIKALVLNPINNDSAVSLIDRIKAEGKIPVISYNSIITSSKIDYWAARDNYQVGDVQAKKAIADNPNGGNWAIVSGPEGLDIAQQKTQGATRVLQSKVDSGNIKIVSHQYHDAWSPQTALAQIENALTKTKNNLQVIIANEDGMALGALQALKDQGLDGKVWLCGEDVFPEVAQNIVKGKMAASAWTDLIQMGHSAADAAFAFATGKPPVGNDTVDIKGTKVPGMRIQSRLVTKENLAEFIKLTGWLKPSDVGLPG